MKSFTVTNKYHDGRCLAFATTSGQACSLVHAHFGDMLDSAYIEWTAVRQPEYDQFAGDRPRIIATEDELPPGAPPYYQQFDQ